MGGCIMVKELFTVSERLKLLRENAHITQAELARTLGVTRAAVNSWEIGLTVPSTTYIIELAKLFRVSTDYILGMGDTETISVEGLNQKQVSAVYEIIKCFNEANNSVEKSE